MTTPAILLGLLIAPTLIGTILNRLNSRTIVGQPVLGCLGITLIFWFTSVGHFIMTEPMAEMLPAWVPGRIPLVYLTGVIEFVAAIAVLVPHWRCATGWLSMLMLMLFLPINIYAAMNGVGMGGHQWGPVYLLIRIPLQAIFVVWIAWFVVRPTPVVPIRFSCEASFEISPDQIGEKILDTSNWSDFQGYGPLPGIKTANFEVRTPSIVGSRIQVQNTDGSSHVEEITEWDPENRIGLRMCDFSVPLSRLAHGIDETWQFERVHESTHVVRSLELHPNSALTRPIVWMISKLLKRAIARHLSQIHT